MTSWLAEYSAALEARDSREKAQSRYINACTYEIYVAADYGS
jgi:hypothetical protein